MALVDTMTIRAAAGRGGDGVVRWLHLRGKEKGGPSGGDGGRGGDVVFRAVRDLAVLARYKGRSEFSAKHGEPGGSDEMHGADGADVVIDVPVGSIITKHSTGEQFELVAEGDEVAVLKGGRGGFGNTHFKSSTNQNPYDSRPGQSGERDTFTVELRIIADAGIVGLPNAGKSSLLNALTRASAKIGDYAFTTLEPNLGVLYGYVLADIPGLIEGASGGKGLGHDFLRHIARTKVLIHCVAGDQDSPFDSYRVVRTELAAHANELIAKPELVFVTKKDTISAERYAEIAAEFEKAGILVLPVSILDDLLVKEASDAIVQFIRKSV